MNYENMLSPEQLGLVSIGILVSVVAVLLFKEVGDVL